MGSTNQRTVAPSVSFTPYSSPTIAWPGYRFSIRPRMNSSESLSATVTGDSSALNSGRIPVPK